MVGLTDVSGVSRFHSFAIIFGERYVYSPYTRGKRVNPADKDMAAPFHPDMLLMLNIGKILINHDGRLNSS